jgi:hypothetical protein
VRALALNGTLKPSPETSNTEALAGVVLDALRERDVEGEGRAAAQNLHAVATALAANPMGAPPD